MKSRTLILCPLTESTLQYILTYSSSTICFEHFIKIFYLINISIFSYNFCLLSM